MEHRHPLSAIAQQIRNDTIEAIGYLGLGHIGGSLSIIEVLTMLYFGHMYVDCEHPDDPDRDILVLSKGHAGPALYATLARKGFFSTEELHTLNRPGTRLPSHCDRLRTPGMDMTAGSLGQGLSVAIGFALASRMDRRTNTIYCIIGDGESNEGQIWEAAMAANQFKLGNLIAFTDCNKMQLDSWTKDVMDMEDLQSKWSAFGWFTMRIDGHDLTQIDRAIVQAKTQIDKPSMIIMDTIKGKGAVFAEHNTENHHMAVTYQQALQAIGSLSKEEL